MDVDLSRQNMNNLPLEILHQVICYLDDPLDTSALSQCNKLLYSACSDDLIWSPHLMGYWSYSNATLPNLYNSPVPLDRRPAADAKERFRKRKRSDVRFEKCILSIVENPYGRLKYVEAISDSFMDAADAIRSFRLRHGRIKKNYGIDYYCCEIERHLSRKMGIHVLQRLASRSENPHNGSDSLYALFGIGCFRCSDGLELHLPSTLAHLRQLVLDEAPDDWSALPLCNDGPPVDSRDVRSKTSIIIKVLYEFGVRPATAAEFYDLRNSFLYCTLKERRATIPITMVAIFVALCTDLGLDAYAVGFPNQVLAAIKDGDGTLFIAPYEEGRCFTRTDLVARLWAFGITDDVDEWLGPCDVKKLCERSARNILNCVERGSQLHTLDGLYAALVTLKLMGQPLPLGEEQFMTLISLHYPYDIGIWEKLQIPEHQELIRRARLEDVTVRRPKRRAEQPVEIRHKLGLVFRHALFNYTAVITGWDPHCDQPPEWIRQMRVNLLERKTQQPFYNVLVSDGSLRYVAEDNILPISDNESPVFQSLADLEIIGKYFKASVGNKFVLSSDLMEAYPDDVPANVE